MELWKEREKKWGTANPHEIQERKTQIALNWVYTWGWSTPLLLDMLVQGKKRGFAKKLCESRLLHATEIYSFTSSMPRQILRMTRAGALHIGKEYKEKKLNMNTLWHNYVVQTYTLCMLLRSGYPQYKIQYIPFPHGFDFKKDYDAVIRTQKGALGIEVELTKKKPIRAHINMFKMLLDIIHGRIYTVLFVSFGKEEIQPYIDIIRSRKLVEYKTDEYRKPYKVREIKIKETLTKRFLFKILPKPLTVQNIYKLAFPSE